VDLESRLFPQWMIEHRIKEEMKVSFLPSELPCFLISSLIFPIFCSSGAVLQNSGMGEHYELCCINLISTSEVLTNEAPFMSH